MKKDEYGVEFSNNGRILYKIPCDLEGEYVVPDGVREIKNNALNVRGGKFPKLSSLRISKSVVKIGKYDYGYRLLDSISVDEDNPVFDSRDNCKAIIETKSGRLIVACKHSSIPEGVKVIDWQAFDKSYAESKIFIPASLEDIEGLRGGFRSYIEVDAANKFFDSRDNCNAIIETKTNTLAYGSSHTVIPYGVESIGVSAFYNCKGIKKMVIPESVNFINHDAFADAEIGELYIPRSVEQISPGAFDSCRIRKFIIDKGNPYFHEQGNCVIARNTSRLKGVGLNYEIPNEVKIISTGSLHLAKGSTIVIPDGVEEIVGHAISFNSADDVKLKLVLPSSIKVFLEQWLTKDEIGEIIVPKGQKERFSRMEGLMKFKHLIVEAEE